MAEKSDQPLVGDESTEVGTPDQRKAHDKGKRADDVPKSVKGVAHPTTKK